MGMDSAETIAGCIFPISRISFAVPEFNCDVHAAVTVHWENVHLWYRLVVICPPSFATNYASSNFLFANDLGNHATIDKSVFSQACAFE
jgi:hypothetical protein